MHTYTGLLVTTNFHRFKAQQWNRNEKWIGGARVCASVMHGCKAAVRGRVQPTPARSAEAPDILDAYDHFRHFCMLETPIS